MKIGSAYLKEYKRLADLEPDVFFSGKLDNIGKTPDFLKQISIYPKNID